MGIEPVPITPGNNCALCFPAGETPTLIKVFISDVKIGKEWVPGMDQPPVGYYDLTQHEINPCTWVGQWGSGEIITLRYWGGNSELLFEGPGRLSGFVALPAIECVRYFTNQNDEFADDAWYGGQAFVCTPAEMAGWISTVTPITGPDPRMELFPMTDGEIVLKFCDKQSATNIKIKIDTALL